MTAAPGRAPATPLSQVTRAAAPEHAPALGPTGEMPAACTQNGQRRIKLSLGCIDGPTAL